MKRKIQQFLLSTGLFATASALGQTSAPMSSQLKMLLQFKGYWETNAATMQTEGKDYKFAYYADFKTTSDNNGIVMHEWATIPGMGKLDGTNLAGINMYDGKVHWFSVDNMGTTHEHVGEFADSKHFSMTYRGMQEGKAYVETLNMEFTDANTLKLKQVATLDGNEVELITGTFHRTKM